jgi:hypothetical protein
LREKGIAKAQKKIYKRCKWRSCINYVKW